MPDINQNRTPERREQPGGQRQAPRSRARKRRRRPVWLTVIIRILQGIGTLLLVGVITGCFMVCFAAIYVKTAVLPEAHLDLSTYSLNENSVIYYQDKNTGQLVELQTLMGTENRELITYEQIPEDLINAFIAIEDKRFLTHNGVDWKRTAAGLLYMLTGRSIQGGSTITQQLIKNVTEYDDVTVNRKIWEIFTALDLENNYDKKYILTLYMNQIWMGNGCRGVQAASKYYFGKNVSDLTLAECASLAGITNNPGLYAPYGTVEVVRYTCRDCKDYYLNKKPATCESCGGKNFDDGVLWTNREYNKARQEIILREMAKPDISPDGAYITEAERDAAIAQPLVFGRDRQNEPQDPEEGEGEGGGETPGTRSTRYSWYVEAVINESIQKLKEKTGLSYDMCEDMVLSGGLSIVCAYDPEVQGAVDNVYNNRANLDQVSLRTGQRLISAISIVDNSTGMVVAMGSTQEKTVDRGWNTPVMTKRQPGSSIKPLSVYSPAIEMGLITPATVIDDNPLELNGRAWPVNVWPNYRGLTTVLYGVTQSLNTVAVRVLDMVTPEASYEFLESRYGITSLVSYLEDAAGNVQSDMNRSPLSMGGLTRGVSTFEMAAAFATFPRNGMFTKASTLLEIKDANGSVVVDNHPVSDPVIKATTAYYINSMLTNAVTSGTAVNARISGQTVAGKTGTTSDAFDYWFCGYTNYYTAAVWTGYPTNEAVNNNLVNPSLPMWQKVMAQLHEGKENAPFNVPEAMDTYRICLDCGNRATPECELDPRGSRVQTFRLFAGDAPAEACVCHVKVDVCVDSPILDGNGEPTGLYHKAGEFCPEESVKTICMVDFQRELATPNVRVGDSKYLLSFYDTLDDPSCHTHTEYVDPSAEPTPSDEPWSTPEPPEPSYDVPNPPTQDPQPTQEPPEPPQPTQEPPAPPSESEPPYVPAGDEEMPDWLRP